MSNENWHIRAAGACTGVPHGRYLLTFVFLVMAAAGGTATASGWPTYRHDVGRSGITSENVSMPMAERWVYRPCHPPKPAWGDPNPRPVGGWHGLTERRRFHFDDAFHVVVSDNAVYFGSSADGRVVSLDAETGNPRWRALTGGPVRLAPTIWNGNVYFGSDDGQVYCLRAEDGSEAWKFHAAPAERKVLGSGKMISLWPVRTGVLVDKGTAYFGAGIFPAEGVYMYAVNARDGQLKWCNDTATAAPQSRISPQGYLLASQDRLFVPLGRVSPAAFSRQDGRLLHESYVEHIIGGTNARLADDKLFTGTEQIIGYDQASHRDHSSWFWSHQLIVSPDLFYAATGEELFAVKRDAYGPASLRRKELLDRKRDLSGKLARARRGSESELKALQEQMDDLNKQLDETEAEMAAGEIWRVSCDCEESLVLAGNVLLAGGDGKVLAFDSTSGQLLWKGDVDGKARGLAVSDNRLFVSSDTGSIHCFGSGEGSTANVIEQRTDDSPFPANELDDVLAAAAERIVQTTGIDRGHCLVLGCGTGRLAHELARRTELRICGIEPDLEKVRAARQALDAAGLYGERVVIEHGQLSDIPFSDYFANLIVSETALLSGRMPGHAEEVLRMLKPLGGRICIGQPATATGGEIKTLSAGAMREWFAGTQLAKGEMSEMEDGVWFDFERGPLPGAGSWTHQYADPGNSTCSDDQLVRCPLGVLWFGGPGPQQMAERHRRAASPLAINGRLFVMGEGTADRIGGGKNSVRAYDAYNGLELWERRIGGALRVSVTHDAGNSAANADSLFVAAGEKCLQLDAATGKTKATYTIPPTKEGTPGRWGYVAVADNVLYGSRTAKGRTADCIFAFDLATGQRIWKHQAAGISQGSIAISEGRLHFAASDVTEKQRQQALAPRVKELHRLDDTERAAVLEELEEATVYNVVTLDAMSGRTLWDQPVEVTGAAGGAYWRSLGAICKNDVLLLFGVFLDGHYWTQFLEGEFESRQVVALSAQNGETLWRKKIGYRVRPLVVGNVLHAEPWAYDLKTGEQRTRIHPVTGREEPWQFARPGHHCGAPAAAPHMLLFRSYELGWYDLDKDFGTQHFAALRPGCWINFIPANGLLMMPEASSGCMCPFANMCTVVFKHKKKNRQWAYFSQPGPMTPVRHLGLNLGAPGDRRDQKGLLWLGYPRPRGRLVLQYEAGLSFFRGGESFCHDPARLDIEGTSIPWVFRSGMSDVRQCRIPVGEATDETARYRVRLAFAELEHEAEGKRVFDIAIQGDIVAEDFDIVQQAGAKNRAVVKEFNGIEATETITVEFIPKLDDPAANQLPVLQGIELEREHGPTVGLSGPRFPREPSWKP
ncbi:MAG: PQQ-binding-like beta-propeller repeat protein [Pirellulaceae bacterium]